MYWVTTNYPTLSQVELSSHTVMRAIKRKLGLPIWKMCILLKTYWMPDAVLLKDPIVTPLPSSFKSLWCKCFMLYTYCIQQSEYAYIRMWKIGSKFQDKKRQHQNRLCQEREKSWILESFFAELSSESPADLQVWERVLPSTEASRVPMGSFNDLICVPWTWGHGAGGWLCLGRVKGKRLMTKQCGCAVMACPWGQDQGEESTVLTLGIAFRGTQTLSHPGHVFKNHN